MIAIVCISILAVLLAAVIQVVVRRDYASAAVAVVAVAYCAVCAAGLARYAGLLPGVDSVLTVRAME